MRLNILFQSQNYSKDLRKEYQHSLLEYDIKHRNIYKNALLRAATIRDRQGKRYLPHSQHCRITWRPFVVEEPHCHRATHRARVPLPSLVEYLVPGFLKRSGSSEW